MVSAPPIGMSSRIPVVSFALPFSSVPGHYQGHWLSATAFLINSTGNATVKAKAEGAVAVLASVMGAWKAKYASKTTMIAPQPTC